MKWKKGGNIAETRYIGSINTTYDNLVKVFGNPKKRGWCEREQHGRNRGLPCRYGDKIRVQWVITFDDGEVATIYDWKMSDEYLGKGQGIPLQKLKGWHVGGRRIKTFLNVLAVLKMKDKFIRKIFKQPDDYDVKLVLRNLDK